ncbi:MAG: AI-2E family transporter [Candidatus Schekmanbacteria bacterium]|nr:MAG: AI-2E family transporter [Candidatus Schekmanbacteria bacterium]
MAERIVIPAKYPQKYLTRDISLIIVFFLLVLLGAYYLRKPLASFYVAAVISYIIHPVVDFIEMLGFRRIVAVIVVFAVLGGGLIIGISSLGPLFIKQVDDIKMKLPEYKVKMQEIGKSIEKRLYKIQFYIREKFPFFDSLHIAEKVIPTALSYVSSSLLDIPALSTFFGIITLVIFVPFFSFFLVLESRTLKKYLVSIVPNRYFEVFVNLLYNINKQIETYLGGVIIEAFIVGFLSTVGLYFLDVNFFLFIGIVVGIINVVPYLGPLVGSLLAIIVTLLDKGSFSAVLQVIVLFIIIRLVDDLVIIPLVISRAMKTHPVIVLMAILVGEYFLGIVGMILAVPFYQIVKIILTEIKGIAARYTLA